MLSNFLRATPVLWLLVKRDLQSRYAGSTLGVVWNVIHPLVLIAIYILVFSNLMAGRGGGTGSRFDYAIHLTAGILPWFFFSEVVSRCTTTLVDNAQFLKKLALPEEVLHVSIFINSALVHTIGLVALAVLLKLAGAPVGPEVVFALPVMLLMGLVGLGIGMLLSVLHLVMRDIGQFVNIGLQFLFWLTPIVYYVTILGDLQWLPRINPVLGHVALIQRLFGSPQPGFMLEHYRLVILLPFFSILVGLAFLRSHRGEILDQL